MQLSFIMKNKSISIETRQYYSYKLKVFPSSYRRDYTWLGILIMTTSSGILGLGIYKSYIPNGHKVPDPCGNGSGYWGPVGHSDRTSYSIRNVNQFGDDFAAAYYVRMHFF